MNKEQVMTAEKETVDIKLYMYLITKRFFDIIFSLIGIVLLIPLTIVIKLIYVISGDCESVFFIQERIGKDGKLFNFYKYRTMVVDADEKLEQLLKNDKEARKEYKKYKKLENDPRITKAGHFLRKTSLDEMPQFINILFGQMSLVGPRPYLLREKKDMGKSYDEITKVKPGLTGYWQVSGRSNTGFKERLAMDEKYVKIRTLGLDIKLFFMTFSKLLKREGAK